jgi:hypothetical protein
VTVVTVAPLILLYSAQQFPAAQVASEVQAAVWTEPWTWSILSSPKKSSDVADTAATKSATARETFVNILI